MMSCAALHPKRTELCDAETELLASGGIVTASCNRNKRHMRRPWMERWAPGLAIAPLPFLVLLFAAQVNMHPPPMELDDLVHEAEARIVSSAKAVTYSVVLAHVPNTVTAEDFEARVIANKVLKISVHGTSIDWHFKLSQPIPQGIKLIPPIEVERRPGDYTGAVWLATVVVPKNIQTFYAITQPVGTAPSAKELPPAESLRGPGPSAVEALPTGGPPRFPRGPAQSVEGPTEYNATVRPGVYPRPVPRPRREETPLASASVPESMPLPSFDN